MIKKEKLTIDMVRALAAFLGDSVKTLLARVVSVGNTEDDSGREAVVLVMTGVVLPSTTGTSVKPTVVALAVGFVVTSAGSTEGDFDWDAVISGNTGVVLVPTARLAVIASVWVLVGNTEDDSKREAVVSGSTGIVLATTTDFSVVALEASVVVSSLASIVSTVGNTDDDLEREAVVS